MITANSEVRPLPRAPAVPRRLPVGVHWLAAVAISLMLWAALIRIAFTLLA
jgi:hypothetical protein